MYKALINHDDTDNNFMWFVISWAMYNTKSFQIKLILNAIKSLSSIVSMSRRKGCLVGGYVRTDELKF